MAWVELLKSLATYNGGQLFVVLAIVVIVVVSIFARHYLAPGTMRQATLDKDRDDAVSILRAALGKAETEKDEAEARERKCNDDMNDRVRQLEAELNGFRWAWSNALALRQRADDVEALQKESKPDV